MRKGTHLASGLLLGILLYSTPEPIISLTAGAIAPDIDSPFSTLHNVFHVRHRGVFHSVTIPIIIYVAYKIFLGHNSDIGANIVIPFIYGYCLHILLDSFTISGTQPLLPFIKKKIHLGNLRTGSIGDKAIGLIFVTLFVLLYAKLL